ncbi:hypothetical protein, partial [Salmonella enterica]|uniref:hypothetical protein n=1 Tax=Salmonella enterica TaxID=28901 RepID=UPI003D2D7BC5
KIQRAATKFRVSKYVFLGRLREADFIPEDKYSELRSQWWVLDSAREAERQKKLKEKSKEKQGGPPPWKSTMADRGRPLAYRVFG